MQVVIENFTGLDAGRQACTAGVAGLHS